MKISRFLVALAIPWPTPGTKACNAAGGLDCPIFGRHRDTASRHDRQIVPMLGPLRTYGHCKGEMVGSFGACKESVT
jgi:hypothetical protein